MTSTSFNRRQFLRASGGMAAGAAVVSSGAVVLVAPNGAWALELRALSEHEGKTVLGLVRRIFPHDTLHDMYYAVVVEALDADAAGNPDMAKKIKDGVAALDGAKGVKWIDLSPGIQLEIITAMQDLALFQTVKGKAVVALYNNDLAWRHFGYEGASAEFGGYIDRGFDDLNWLPDPPQSASPKKA